MTPYFHVFYTIEPRPELAAWLRERVKPEFADDLLKPIAYHIEEADDASWTEADRLLKAKLLFLHGLRERWCWALRETFDCLRLFGWAELRETHFDQWWTIRRSQAAGELGDLQRTLPYVEEPVPPTGSERVDGWLESIKFRPHTPVVLGSVLFVSPGELHISPLVHGSWERPILDLLDESGPFGSDVFGACAEFVAWCLSKNPRPANLSVSGLPWPNSDEDRYERYDKVVTEIATWKEPPYLVDLGEFIITHRDQIVWPAAKRGTPRWKDPRVKRPDSPFQWGWSGVKLGDIRPGRGTYNWYALDSLPPIRARLDGSFAWLESARGHREGAADGDALQATLSRLIAQCPVALPKEFIRFFGSPALRRKIRSCTGCGLDLDAAATPFPGGLGHLVRFMSDYQGCISFCLHISPCGTSHTVVATYHFAGSDRGGRPHLRDTTACADSFEEFLYRFWIENELWYALFDNGPMPENGEEYLAHYRRAAGAGA